MTPRALLRVALQVWSRFGTTVYLDLPQPLDTGPVTIAGPRPVQVLVFGTDAASGWGALRQDLALPGQLGRALHHATGRGARVVLVDCGVARIEDLAVAAASLPTTRFDAVVVVGGVADAVTLEDPQRWRVSLSAVLARLRAASDAQLFLTGIPLPSTLPAFRVAVGAAPDRSCQELNRVSEDLCASLTRATFVPSLSRPAASAQEAPLVSAASYAALAAHLVASIAPRL